MGDVEKEPHTGVSRRKLIAAALPVGVAAVYVGSSHGGVGAHQSGRVDIVQYSSNSSSPVVIGSDSDQAQNIAAVLGAPTRPSEWFFPAGEYRIASTALIYLSESIDIVCDPDAVFTATVDGDLFQFRADNAADPVNVLWIGGQFDVTAQPVSRTVPWPAQYPPPAGQAGTSNTATCLDFRSRMGTFNHVTVVDTVMSGQDDGNGGHRWEHAGGDTGIFLEACSSALIAHNRFRGIRDLGVYLSAGAEDCRNVVVSNNEFIGCAGGAAIKRGGSDITFSDNSFSDCVRGVISQGAGSYGGASDVTVSGNRFVRCWRAITVELSTRFTAVGNTIEDLGVTVVMPPLEAGGDPRVESPPNRSPFKTAAGEQRAAALYVRGSYWTTFQNNRIEGVIPGWSHDEALGLLVEVHSNGSRSDLISFRNNWVIGELTLAEEPLPPSPQTSPPTRARTRVTQNYTNVSVAPFVPVGLSSIFNALTC